MIWNFERMGYFGLAMVLWLKAKSLAGIGTSTSLWRHLVADYEEGTYYLYFLLISLSPPVVVSLIKNTLPRDIYNDPDIHRFAQDHFTPSPCPGVYMNIPARGSLNLLNFANQAVVADAGKWLSGLEVELLLQHVKLYLGTGKSADDFAYSLDSQLKSNQAHIAPLIKTRSLRRYAKNDSERGHLASWAGVIEELYCTNLPASKRFENFLRCPSEVGWSIDQKKRLGQHVKNIHTTPIFAFFHAWSLFSGKFPTTQQYTLFRVWAKEIELARVAEIGGTLLLSSMCEDGGLNCAAPGNMSWGSNSPSGSAAVWRVNKEATFVFRPHVSAALDQDIAIWKRQFNASQRIQEIEDLPRDNKRLRERLDDVRKEVEGSNDSKEGLKKEGDDANAAYLEQLDRELPTPHPIITPFRSVAIGCIRQLGSIDEGIDKAHKDLWHCRATDNSGIVGAEAVMSYRATVLRVKERQTKAVSIWKRHMESFDEMSKRDWEDGTRKFKDLKAAFELCGSPLDPAARE